MVTTRWAWRSANSFLKDSEFSLGIVAPFGSASVVAGHPGPDITAASPRAPRVFEPTYQGR
jgi:hypothetical protein